MSDWIDWEWTREKPYPETLDTLVYVSFEANFDAKTAPRTVKWWGGDESNQTYSSWFLSDDGLTIVSYKVAKTTMENNHAQNHIHNSPSFSQKNSAR